MYNLSDVCLSCDDKICCKYPVFVSPFEIKTISDFLGIDVETFSFVAVEGDHLRISSSTKNCLFLVNGRCVLNSARPYICKVYKCSKLVEPFYLFNL